VETESTHTCTELVDSVQDALDVSVKRDSFSGTWGRVYVG